MNTQEELQTVSNIILFLKRANLSGDEVAAFNQAMAWLGSKHQDLSTAKLPVPELSPDPAD